MTLLQLAAIAQRRHRTAGLACLIALAATGCTKRLPPAPTPQAIAPASLASRPAPPAGQSRLVVDVVDGPTPVHRVQMVSEPVDLGDGRTTFRFLESPVLFCSASPCIADVAPGNLLLGFPVPGDPAAMEMELVHVGQNTSVYRRALSHYDGETGATRVLGIIAASLGGASAMTGTALLPIGLADDHDALTATGAITLGAGAALITLGILAINADAPTYRPGSSVHFSIPPGGR